MIYSGHVEKRSVKYFQARAQEVCGSNDKSNYNRIEIKLLEIEIDESNQSGLANKER